MELTLSLKIVAICTTLFFGVVGFVLPFVVSKFKCSGPDSTFFVLVKAFAGGVILSTAFMHVMPEGVEMMKSHIDSSYPFSFLVMLGSIALIMIIEMITHSCMHKHAHVVPIQDSPPQSTRMLIHNVADDLESARQTDEACIKSQIQISLQPHECHHIHTTHNDASYRHSRGKAQMVILELSVAVHSVIIGLAFAISSETPIITNLLIVLTVHQFTEGIAIGSICIGAELQSNLMKIIMGGVFALTTPVAILVGIFVIDSLTNSLGSKGFELVQGILYSVSSGLLMYTGFVEIVAQELQKVTKNAVRFGFGLMFFVGASIFAVMAIWA